VPSISITSSFAIQISKKECALAQVGAEYSKTLIHWLKQ